MTARIMVFAQVATDEGEAFEKAYLQVAERMRGTSGLLADELLRGAADDGQYVLLSEWESVERFHTWHDDDAHREVSAPMRPYWAGSTSVRIYDLAARLSPSESR